MHANDNYKYMVSIYMTTYYHKNYVRQAIDSILNQKVSFTYEIVISDDCSSDGTQEILKEYENKYNFIRVNYNEKNIGLSSNMFFAKSLCIGKYIISLSGDDYWIDDKKLQKQVEFLETHTEYIGITTRLEARSEDSGMTYYVLPDMKQCNKTFTLEDYINGKNFPLNGMMMRNVIKKNYDMFASMPKISPFIDDTTDCLFILTLGDIYISDDVTVAYRLRIAKKGEHNFNSINTGMTKFEKNISLLNELDKYFLGKYDLFHRYKRVIAPAIYKYYRPRFTKKFTEILNTIPDKYMKRRLIMVSIIYIPEKAIELFKRKFSNRGYCR